MTDDPPRPETMAKRLLSYGEDYARQVFEHLEEELRGRVAAQSPFELAKDDAGA